jgi:hypothetical protein
MGGHTRGRDDHAEAVFRRALCKLRRSGRGAVGAHYAHLKRDIPAFELYGAAFNVGQSLSEPMMMATFLVFSIIHLLCASLKRKKGRGAVTPWPYACSFSAVILFPQPAGAPKKRAVSRRRTAPAGRPAAYTPPRVRSGSQSDRLHPGTSLNSLFGAKKKDIIIVL